MTASGVCSREHGRFRFRSTGKERNAESGGGDPTKGNDYFVARYYASPMGRFIEPDPLPWLEWQSGDKDDGKKLEAYLENPQNFDMYAYARNNPLANTDPDGMATCFYYVKQHELFCIADQNGKVVTVNPLDLFKPDGTPIEPITIIQVGPNGVSSGNGAYANNPSQACLNSIFKDGDPNSGGPILPGQYQITYMSDRSSDRHDRFDLAELPRDIVSRAIRAMHHRRRGWQLHRGTITHGCINVDQNNPDAMKQFDQVKKLLLDEQDIGNTLYVIK